MLVWGQFYNKTLIILAAEDLSEAEGEGSVDPPFARRYVTISEKYIWDGHITTCHEEHSPNRQRPESKRAEKRGENLEGRGPKDPGDYPRAGAGGEGERDGGREAGGRGPGGPGGGQAGSGDGLPRRRGEDRGEGGEEIPLLFCVLEGRGKGEKRLHRLPPEDDPGGRDDEGAGIKEAGPSPPRLVM